MLKARDLIYILVFLKLTEANTRFYSTSCETFDVKSDVKYDENFNANFNENLDDPIEYEDDYGDLRIQNPVPVTELPRTLYSYAECRYARLNPSHKLHFYNTNLKYILFQHSDIPLIPVGVFSTFENLTQLYLNDSNVRTIHPGAFNGLGNLEELYLQNNNITELTRGTLNSLSHLKILNMSNNMLTSIEENAMLGLFNLYHMDLSINILKNLSSTVFKGLSSVTFLNLSHNYISEISSNLFANLSKHDISFYSHHFVPFPDHSRKVSGLHLDLSYNRLITIDFSYFPISQRNLHLANNHINSLENLHYLTFLEILDLSNNQITDIVAIPLKLHYLNASGNRINNLSNALFHDVVPSLVSVDFSFNFITDLHEDMFQGLQHLVDLNLQNNKLNKLPIGCFRDLNSLLLLNISSNRITKFEFGTFSGMSNLRILDISNNTLTDLFENTFYSLTSLETLNIGDNFLTTFDSHDLLKHVKGLRTVSLNNNPWHCNSLLNIITNFESNTHEVDVLSGPPLKVRNIRGIACSDYNFNNTKELNFETSISNGTFEKSSANSKQLEMLRNFFNGEFLNSSFYKFFQNYNDSLEINSSRDFLKYFGDDFKNTTFYRYFDQDFSNVTFFKSFNETLFRYSTAVHGMFDETLNTSLNKFSNADSLGRGFSKYFEDGYKNSSFYKYFNKEFANSGFFKFFNGERGTELNSTLKEIAFELRSIRNFFSKDFKNSSFYRLLEEDHINRNFNLSRLTNFVPEEFSTANSNSTPAFAKLIDNFGRQGNQDILVKISDLQNGITVLMIIVIIILICMMLLFALRNFTVPFKRSVNRPVSINVSNKSESTSGLELM